MKALKFLSICYFSMVSSVFANHDLLSSARAIADGAQDLLIDTKVHQNSSGISSADLLHKAQELERLLLEYKNILQNSGAGSVSGLGQCIKSMLAINYNQTYAAEKCAQAGAFAYSYGSCTAVMVGTNYNHSWAGEKCLEAGAYAEQFGQCAKELVSINYNHTYASDSCLKSASFAFQHASCTKQLVGLNYNHSYAAEKCQLASHKAEVFASCVKDLIALNYNHAYAAEQCLK